MYDQQSLRSACAYVQSDQSLCQSLEYSVSVKLLTEHHLEYLSLKGGCTGLSEYTLVKMPHCWKSHVTAHMVIMLFVCWPKFVFFMKTFICHFLRLWGHACPLDTFLVYSLNLVFRLPYCKSEASLSRKLDKNDYLNKRKVIFSDS